MKNSIYISVFLLTSCVGTVEKSKSAKWFDLKQYIQQQSSILAKNTRLEKSLQMGKEQEVKQIEVQDWAKELSLFAQSDINRPAWQDKYQVDTLRQGEHSQGVAMRIQHLAKDKLLKTKALYIDFNAQNEVVAIEVLNEQKTFFSKNTQHLIFKPKIGYSVTATQTLMFSDSTQMVIKARFL